MTKASLFYKRSYTNGYEQKVNYYLDRLDQEIQNEDVEQIKFCKKKLDYFLDKQIEYIAKKQHDLFAERVNRYVAMRQIAISLNMGADFISLLPFLLCSSKHFEL
jgi:hypothetical protein